MLANQPLAERMRPRGLDAYVGQDHLAGKDSTFRKSIESGIIPSFILWGPPGVGKTTLASVIAGMHNRPFHKLSAVHSGVKDVREAIDKAKKQQFFDSPNPILFIDEIHRFSKSQQDSLLGAVEQGTITLIGATTENPSFEIISPLLSRCQIYVLKPIEDDDLKKLADHAIKNDTYLKEFKIVIQEYEALFRLSGGDARKLYNTLELVISAESSRLKPGKKNIKLNDEIITAHVQRNMTMYDKGGEQHYDIISAFIKSIRGSDPNAAVYWLARMVEGGEDVKFIARRLVILAAEDIGLANPNAILMSQSCFDAVSVIGWPESRIILSQLTIYLATSAKSNSSYQAINEAMDEVRRTGDTPVPLHLRNAPTRLMKDLNYGADYKYAHSYQGNFIKENYLPDAIKGKIFYEPGNNPREKEFREKLSRLWEEFYDYNKSE
jgi:putative ATPase